jgi:hypothetical protein
VVITEHFGLSLTLILTPLVLFLVVLPVLLPVLGRLLRQCHVSEVTPEWLENFSPITYRPMEFLLADADFDFLVRQPGFEASLSKKLRKDRVRIFRQYLNRLIGDFNRLHVYARYLIAQSRDGQDHSALLARLIWLRFRFSFTILRVEASLLLSYFGSQPRVVHLAIAHLYEMNGYLNAITTA